MSDLGSFLTKLCYAIEVSMLIKEVIISLKESFQWVSSSGLFENLMMIVFRVSIETFA